MKLLVSLVCLYLMLVALIFLRQRDIQYYPDTSPPGEPILYGIPEMIPIRLQTSDHLTLNSWYIAPQEDHLPVIILFHGNAGHIGHRAFKARLFIDQGYGVFLAEYRGYGGNPGKVSEAGFYQDGRAAMNYVLEEAGIPADRIVIYGESIGSGVAVQMATEYAVAGLVLESAFSSAVDAGKSLYPWLPVQWLLRDRYENLGKIKSIHNAPLFMIHGDQDNVVSYKLGRKLFEAAEEPKSFYTVKDGGHNDLYDRGAVPEIFGFLKILFPVF